MLLSAMAKVRILHNPRCTKSRQTLELVREHVTDADLQVVEYLKQPLSAGELSTLAKQLGLRPKAFIRTKEPEFAELGLGKQLDDDAALFAAMERVPKLMDRPIVVVGRRAALGRPPEAVLELFE
jgi:arsenate reductase